MSKVDINLKSKMIEKLQIIDVYKFIIRDGRELSEL